MEFLSIIIISFAFIFLTLYMWRIRKRRIEVSAVVINIEEAKLEVPDLYQALIYYYPVIRYEYYIDNNKYTGEITKKDSRRYRVLDVDFYGAENLDDKFFWRSLKNGDVINIEVNRSNYNDSQLSIGEAITYKSETKMFLYVAILFFMMFIALIFIQLY